MKKIKITFSAGRVYSEDKKAKDLYSQSRFGEAKEKKIIYSLVEGLYLLEKKKALVYDGKNKKLSIKSYIRKASKLEPNFWVRYCAFKDMRNRGYIVKTALKFGADFRIYERGKKPGEAHAKWILYPVRESAVMSMYEFSAKNRVAHSTRKKLLLAVVDEESDCTYYTIEWIKP